jgi:zinc transport system substrate-binding protein
MVMSTALLAGCSAPGHADGTGPSVVAAFYPYAFVAERIVGARASVTNLTAPGLEPHDLELTAQQVGSIEQADVVVFERGFQPAVDEAVDQNAEGRALDVTSVVPLEDTGAPDVAVDRGSSLAGDPHIWLDPIRLAKVAEAFAQTMGQVDPAHARAYRLNAARLVADLRALDRAYRTGLSHCARTEFVTSHAAFGYLAERYGLQMVAISGLTPDAEPSPARLSELAGLVGQDGITTVFSEVLASQQIADTLAHEVGVRTDVLDPIEGLPEAGSSKDYLSIMRANLAALEKANGCS